MGAPSSSKMSHSPPPRVLHGPAQGSQHVRQRGQGRANGAQQGQGELRCQGEKAVHQVLCSALCVQPDLKVKV